MKQWHDEVQKYRYLAGVDAGAFKRRKGDSISSTGRAGVR